MGELKILCQETFPQQGYAKRPRLATYLFQVRTLETAVTIHPFTFVFCLLPTDYLILYSNFYQIKNPANPDRALK
ncbi:hypothetical protein G3570_12415 [Balneolaceae bacterium YR4-1]|uniref:Uncharacterized protein n=1 Tax=Halalkalibaculum roseum TaxID=2709311 RepID=A0A6M1TBG9_9BACT|nr:hypothetical protein [Halalkalibaculum roseum]NGP77443.1 hypothetical protein [Halalkalibaculum roseum]